MRPSVLCSLCALLLVLLAVSDARATSKRKISKLMAFPRVGRGNSRSWLQEGEFDAPGKRNSASNGMWFGPRLGRVQKRDALLDGSGIPQTYIILGGEELLPRGIDYTPRLGRDSEETNEEVVNDLGGPLLVDSP